MLNKLSFLFLALCFAFVSCGDNNKDEPTTPQDNKVSLDKIEGVWALGDYFVSFSSDRFCTSFVSPGFLDSGDFQLADAEVVCHNSHFDHKTKYTIKSVSDTKMSIEVQYIDFRGNSKTVNLNLSKTSELPVKKDNSLIGKSYTAMSSSFGTITYSYSTYCNGQKTASSGSAKKYPLNIFYIWRNGKCYEQFYTNKNQQTPTIGSWTTTADDGAIFIYSITFAADGSIELVKKINTIELE